MKTLANILWIMFGGLVLSILWALTGLFLCLTIVGIPFGVQCFKFANLMLFPFGRKVVYEGGAGSLLLNILCIVFCGIHLAFGSLIIGILWCVTIIGIPIGLQIIKFAKLSFVPFGAKIV